MPITPFSCGCCGPANCLGCYGALPDTLDATFATTECDCLDGLTFTLDKTGGFTNEYGGPIWIFCTNDCEDFPAVVFPDDWPVPSSPPTPPGTTVPGLCMYFDCYPNPGGNKWRIRIVYNVAHPYGGFGETSVSWHRPYNLSSQLGIETPDDCDPLAITFGTGSTFLTGAIYADLPPGYSVWVDTPVPCPGYTFPFPVHVSPFTVVISLTGMPFMAKKPKIFNNRFRKGGCRSCRDTHGKLFDKPRATFRQIGNRPQRVRKDKPDANGNQGG